MVTAGRFRRGLGAAIAALLLAVGGSVASSAQGAALDDLLPNLHTTFSAIPSPIPVPSEGRIPVSLRLADSVWTDDGSHPPAATEIRFEFDKSYRLDLAGVERCLWAPLQSYPAFDWSTCAPAIVAGGRIKWELADPEGEVARVGAEAIAYRGRANRLLVRTEVPAPVSGEVVIPVKLSRGAKGVYDLKATATIPKIAGGSGSLTYLGLRFRKGLFSAACPKGRLQVGVRNAFDDGELSLGGFFATC
ncbi:MAG TPA: hypothetical protein VFN18_12370 [Solirubrobacterales bacterium]|nr:hypothetical protein [Solirubrobacterales bacterium]